MASNFSNFKRCHNQEFISGGDFSPPWLRDMYTQKFSSTMSTSKNSLKMAT